MILRITGARIILLLLYKEVNIPAKSYKRGCKKIVINVGAVTKLSISKADTFLISMLGIKEQFYIMKTDIYVGCK